MLLRDDRKNYVVTGLFVVVALAMLVSWIAVLSGWTGATDRYTARFESVMGLDEGTEVLFEGFRVGVIDRIEPGDAGDFEVELAIRSGWPVPEDSVVRLASSGLLSSVVLNIERGDSERLLEPGSPIRSQPPSDVFAAVGELADELSRLVREDLTPLVSTMADGTPQIVDNVVAVTERLRSAADELAHVMSEENHQTIDRILANFEEGSGRMSTLGAELGETRRRLDSVLARVDDTLSRAGPDAEAALADLRLTLEAVARHADSVTHHLEATARNMNEFSAEIRRDPSLLLRGREDVEPEEGER